MAGTDDNYDDEAGRITSLDALSKKLDDLAGKVEQLFTGSGGGGGNPGRRESGSPGRQTAAETADDRRREIREELSALRRQEKADEDFAAMHQRVGKLERAAERPPRQLRAVERFMKWDSA